MAYMAAVHSNWMTMFEGLKFSSKQFYDLVEKHMQLRGIPKLKMHRITLKEGGIFSDSREYLRIEFQDLAYDICAAPFGNDFFVSYWFGNTSSVGKELAGKMFGALASGRITYFKLDTQAMFKESVRLSIQNAIEEISNVHGIRSFQPPDLQEVEMS